MSAQACGNCVFFGREGLRRKEKEHRGTEYGSCRVDGPHLGSVWIGSGAFGDAWIGLWPFVSRDAWCGRHALDTRRITITFDGGKEFDRQQIARLYRVARVVSHVATNGRVVIEADVPRRFIERLTTPSPQENIVDAS